MDNARHMGIIGFHDTAESRAAIRAHLERVPCEDGNIVEFLAPKTFHRMSSHSTAFSKAIGGGPAEVRESLLQGPGGSVKLRSTWEVRYGVRRLTTVRPDGPPRSARPIASHPRSRGTVRRRHADHDTELALDIDVPATRSGVPALRRIARPTRADASGYYPLLRPIGITTPGSPSRK